MVVAAAAVAAAAVAAMVMMVVLVLVMVMMMMMVVVARFVVVVGGGDGGGVRVRVRVCCSYPAVARKFPSGCHENRMAPPVPDSCHHFSRPCKQGCPSNRSVGRSVVVRGRHGRISFASRCVSSKPRAPRPPRCLNPQRSLRGRASARGAVRGKQAPHQAVRTSSRRPSMPKELRTVAWREGWVERGEAGGEARSGPTTTAAVAAKGRLVSNSSPNSAYLRAYLEELPHGANGGRQRPAQPRGAFKVGADGRVGAPPASWQFSGNGRERE